MNLIMVSHDILHFMVRNIQSYTQPPLPPSNLCVWGIGVGSRSRLCGMRGSAGPGDDEQRKWVSMDDWREMEGEKMDKERTEQSGAEQEQEGVLLDHYRWHIHSWGRGGDGYGSEVGLNWCWSYDWRRGARIQTLVVATTSNDAETVYLHNLWPFVHSLSWNLSPQDLG